MINNFILALGLLITCLSAQAQVPTGGVAIYSNHVGFEEVANTIKLEKHLIKRDAICSPKDRVLKDGDLMQTYLRLSLFKRHSSDDKCDEADKYFACLNDTVTKSLIEKSVKNPNFPYFLKERYKINKAEADAIVKFYVELDAKIK